MLRLVAFQTIRLLVVRWAFVDPTARAAEPIVVRLYVEIFQEPVLRVALSTLRALRALLALPERVGSLGILNAGRFRLVLLSTFLARLRQIVASDARGAVRSALRARRVREDARAVGRGSLDLRVGPLAGDAAARFARPAGVGARKARAARRSMRRR